MHITSAIFPVRHSRARLHAHMSIAGSDKRLFDDDLRICEAFFEVTVGPFIDEFASRFFARSELVKLCAGPFNGLKA